MPPANNSPRPGPGGYPAQQPQQPGPIPAMPVTPSTPFASQPPTQSNPVPPPAPAPYYPLESGQQPYYLPAQPGQQPAYYLPPQPGQQPGAQSASAPSIPIPQPVQQPGYPAPEQHSATPPRQQPAYPPIAGTQPQNSGYIAHPSQMQPTYPAQVLPAQPAGTPYDFFLESKPKPAKKRLPGNGSKFTTILLLAAAAFAALIVLAIVLSIFRGGQGDTPGLSSLTSNQQRIIRTSDAGLKTLESQNLINFATTAKVSTTSAQQELITYINQRGGTIDAKQLALISSPAIDQSLEAAQAAGTYDAVFTTAMQSLLSDYITNLKKIINAKPAAGERAIVEKELSAAQLLLQMISQP